MSPTSMETERKNAKIIQRVANWTEKDGTGECFGSSGMFTLPNGAKRSPDAAWTSKSHWNRLTDEEQNSFAGICPEFVIELRSSSDRLSKIQEKMDEYMANGARLGWLLDPLNNCAYVYSPDVPAKRLDQPTFVSGDPPLPGFEFDFREILG